MIYTHFQQAINKAVTGSCKANRDELPVSQLEIIELLEYEVKVTIDNSLSEGADPLEVRNNVLASINNGCILASSQVEYE